MEQVKATFKNSFCMDHKCIHWYEDMCMLAMAETGQSIAPYDCEYIKKHGRGKSKDCESFAMGCCIVDELAILEEED